MTEVTPEADQADPPESLDFDAFWSAHSTQRETVRILGEDVPVPADVPLWLTMQANDTGQQDEAALRRMVAELYGEHMLDRWIERGMGGKRLSVLIAWSVARAQGSAITFAEAAERIEQIQARSSEHPPANRASRRARKKKHKPTS